MLGKKLHIKVCGVVAHLEELDALELDYLGFIFWKPSSRYNSAAALPSTQTQKVGVFVDATVSEIAKAVSNHNLAAVQLHGKESPEMVKELKQRLDVMLIKALPVKTHADIEAASAFEEVADLLLFDAAGKLPGGNGYAFNWDLLKAHRFKKPFMLSGGLGLDNFEQAWQLAQQHPDCVGLDFNSALEDAPGVKNLDKVRELISETKKLAAQAVTT